MLLPPKVAVPSNPPDTKMAPFESRAIPPAESQFEPPALAAHPHEPPGLILATKTSLAPALVML